jgi:hypothetical protein
MQRDAVAAGERRRTRGVPYLIYRRFYQSGATHAVDLAELVKRRFFMHGHDPDHDDLIKLDLRLVLIPPHFRRFG